MVNKLYKWFTQMPEKMGKITFISGEKRIVFIYRYVSWVLSSLFYIMDTPRAPLLLKIGVIISLFIAAKITLGFYNRHSDNKRILRQIVIIETIGIAILLIPTGGLESPFIWYAISAVLVAAIYFPIYFSWINLLFYMSAAIVINYWFVNGLKVPLASILQGNFHLFLVFILINFSVQLYSNLTKRLNAQAEKLKHANRRIEKSMKHIMSLYQTVEAFTTQINTESLLHTFAYYTSKLTGSTLSFLWIKNYNGEKTFVTYGNDDDKSIKSYLKREIDLLWDNMKREDLPYTIETSNQTFVLYPVKTSTKYYGILGIKVDSSGLKELYAYYNQQLTFISRLSSIVLDRLYLEKTAANMMIIEEQNRIANEVHDSVSQRLFSIVCSIHALSAKWEKMPLEELQRQLELIRKSANIASQELRSCIYKLSSKKRGEESFIQSIKDYLYDFSMLNDIDIEFNSSGKEDFIPGSLKKSIYRILYESCSNAVRHGHCKKIVISMCVEPSYLKLGVLDDGKGFSIKSLSEKNNFGLGISNMKKLVESHGGKFEIKSEIGKGTEIQVYIETQNMNTCNQGGMAI